MRLPLALLTILLCFAPSLSATVLLPAEFREIVNGSQIIVYGRVSSVRPQWTDGRRRIETLVTIDAADVYRGTPSRTITFRVPGGQIGRYKSVTVGAPEFRPGDEAVLFLKAQGPAVPHVFGLNQGVFPVRVDARTGRRLVTVPVVTARSAAPEVVARGDRSRRPLPLPQFVAQLKSAMQAGGR
jgi:hypothetical protein